MPRCAKICGNKLLGTRLPTRLQYIHVFPLPSLLAKGAFLLIN